MRTETSTGSTINPLGKTETELPSRSLGDDQTLADTLGEDVESRRSPQEFEGPRKIGRYVFLELLGEGGMGMVIAAYDPTLDRRVAIKLLHMRGNEGEQRLRMEREAQAMAKLSHPNVVTVYEVGEYEGQLFVAMEFVKGQDLRQWLVRHESADWRTVLEPFIQAGHGLAAAHRAGLVHRDFKAANVFVGEDGRARVGDFGLARRDVDDPDTIATRHKAQHAASSTALTQSMTATGAAVGTPSYMSPEQFRGDPTDARTDQFSFCAALWEALYGQRPFLGDTVMQLMSNVLEGNRRPPPPGNGVPTWLRKVLDRGLSLAPDDRYPSTEAMLAALQADPTKRRRVWIAAATGALAIAGWLGGRAYLEAQQVAACEADGTSIDATWNPDVQAKLVRVGEAANARASVELAMHYFDAQAQAWKQARTQACLDTRVHGTWDEDTLDRSVWCLDEHQMQMAALVAQFMEADAKAIDELLLAAADLSGVESCLDAHRLAMLPPLPQHDRERIQAVLRSLSQTDALGAVGEYQAGLELATAALAQAEQLDWPPLAAAAHLHYGDLLDLSGKFPEAEAQLEAAYFRASEVGALEVAAEAAIDLAFTVGYDQARYDEGIRWARHADVSLSALGMSENSHWRSNASTSLGLVFSAMGEPEQAKLLFEQALAIDETLLGPEHPIVAVNLGNLALALEELAAYDEAERLHERALAIRERALGPESLDVANSLNNLANVYLGMGRYEQAKSHYERALAIRERLLGPEHPDVATSLNNLAGVYRSMGKHEQAKPLDQRALAIRTKLLGPEHPSIATSLNNLASAHLALGEYEQAKPLYEQALAIYEKALGPEHPNVASTLGGLGLVCASLGQLEQARSFQARALDIRERAQGPEHPDTATAVNNLANVYLSLGEYEQAKALHERAIAIYEKTLGPDYPRVAYSLIGLARIALEQHQPAQAVPLAERAVRILARDDGLADKLAQSRFVLAQALWDASVEGPDHERDHQRALVLAQQARDRFVQVPGKADKLAEVDAFLAEHGVPANPDTP